MTDLPGDNVFRADYHDAGILLSWPSADDQNERRQGFALPVDDAVSIPYALRACVIENTEQIGSCFAVAPHGDDVVLLFAAAVGAPVYGLRLELVNAFNVAKAIQAAIDKRDKLMLDLNDIAELPETEGDTP